MCLINKANGCDDNNDGVEDNSNEDDDDEILSTFQTIKPVPGTSSELTAPQSSGFTTGKAVKQLSCYAPM